MIDKPVGAITKGDIDALIQSGRMEDRQIDYKRDLAGSTDDDKREFLRDVSSFANALGGDILYGIEETGGLPTAAPGVPISNFDELRLRLQNTIQSNLDPRLPSVEVDQVSGFPNGSVTIVRIQQSWRAPHMVTFRGLGKFYVRGNGQRHEMDVTELRAAFVGSEAIAERIRAFRDGRIAHILSGQSAMKTFNTSTLVMHVVPIGTAFTRVDVDPRQLVTTWRKLNEGLDQNRARELFELVHSAAGRPNLDGLLISSARYEQQYGFSPSFIQVFRNGAIEFTDGSYREEPGTIVPGTWVTRERVEAQVLDSLRNAITFRSAAALAGPVIVSVAFLRGRDIAVRSRSRMPFSSGRAFDRDVIVLPDVVLDETVADVALPVRLIFDSLWQSAGFSGSESYAESGEYVRPRMI
jgi:hypothetical protein